MTKYDFIKKLSSNGDLQTAIKMGVVKSSVKKHVNIYERYLKYRRKGDEKMQSYSNAATDFKCHEIYVCNLVKQMESSY